MKKLFSLSICIYVLVGSLFMIQPAAVSAQSFLSDKRNDTPPEMPAASAPEKSDQVAQSPDTDSGGAGTSAIKTPLPEEQKPQVEAQLSPEQEPTVETGTTNTQNNQEKLLPNMENLLYIGDLIEEEEYNHALNNLNILSAVSGEYPDEDSRFRVGEMLQFLYVKVYYLLGNYEKARELARKYFNTYSNGENFFYAYYFFSSALAHLDMPMEHTELITEDFFDRLSTREASNLRKYLIKDALRQKRFLVAFNYLEEREGQLFEQYSQWYQKIIVKIEDIDDINELLERFPQADIQTQLYLRKVQLLTVRKEFQNAQDTLKIIQEKEDLDSDTLAEIQTLQKFISLTLNTDPYKIGVILPTSFKRHKKLSQQVIDGLELALQSFVIKDKPIELVFKDSTVRFKKGESLRSKLNRQENHIKDVIRDLVEVENVIAILGPLAKQASIAAKNYSEQFNIPIVSFSRTENIGEDAPFMFRFNRKRTQEAKVIAHYATDYLNARRFVLFYPSGKKGFELIQAFSNVVKQKGGEIVGFARMRPNQVDFQKSFLSFTDGYREVSKKEQEELKKGREQLKPVVDFDAIFAPTTTNTLEIISSFKTLFEADKTWLLALSDINVPENQLLSHTRRLRFIDAYANSDSKTYLQPFFESHWRSFNYRKNYQPPTDYTVYAYEALEILSKLLNDPQNHNREALKKAIEELKQFPVLTGHVTTDEKGELIKELKILKLKKKNTVEVF